MRSRIIRHRLYVAFVPTSIICAAQLLSVLLRLWTFVANNWENAPIERKVIKKRTKYNEIQPTGELLKIILVE